jgi:hypothetical protein
MLGAVFSGALIYDATGKQVGTVQFPLELTDIQPVTAQTVYSPNDNAIDSLDETSNIWQAGVPSRGVGAVAGSHVVFASGARVYALSH